jgi:Cys-rich protein (TIGR01571 family)
MAWWQAWSAFVGMFVARVSRGRTIGEMTIYSFAAPFLYACVWFCTFGGAGLRQARQALELKELGNMFFGTEDYYLADGSTYCYDVPQQDVLNGTDVVFTNSLLGITPVCEFNSAESGQAWFNVMYSFSFPLDGFEGFGPFMAGLSLVAVCIYFITSSDSGSLVVDHLASNGALNHHWVQRLFWAFTEGAVATALLLAGGGDALSALQALSIVFGLPFTLLVLWFCQSILRMCERLDELGESNDIQDYVIPKSFHMSIFGGIFNWMEYAASLGNVHPERVALGMDKPTSLQSSQFITALFVPFVTLNRALKHVYPKEADAGYVKFVTGIYTVFHLMWIALFICAVKSRLFIAVAFGALFINGCVLTGVRTDVREKLNLQGDTFSDFLASSFMYFQVLTQIVVEYEEGSGAGNSIEEVDA